MSQPWFERFQRNLALWRSSTLLTCTTVKNLKFRKSKMAAAAIFKNPKTPYLGCNLSDFNEIWHTDAVPPSWRFRPLKIWNFKNPRSAAIFKNQKIAIRCSYNFATGRFHTKKLCSTFFRQKLNFTCKNSKIAFCATLWGLRGNVHGSPMARWKAHGRLPISANWTFFTSSHGSGAMSGYW